MYREKKDTFTDYITLLQNLMATGLVLIYLACSYIIYFYCAFVTLYFVQTTERETLNQLEYWRFTWSCNF